MPSLLQLPNTVLPLFQYTAPLCSPVGLQMSFRLLAQITALLHVLISPKAKEAIGLSQCHRESGQMALGPLHLPRGYLSLSHGLMRQCSSLAASPSSSGMVGEFCSLCSSRLRC